MKKLIIFFSFATLCAVLDRALGFPCYNVAIIPAIIAGAGMLAGSAIGASISSKNQSKTNATNLQIAREQNAANLEQWNREAAFTERMWNQSNEYNSAKSQVERYREAGINPYLAMQNQGAGTAEASTAPAGSPAAGATMQADQQTPALIAGMVQNAAGAMSQLSSSNLAMEQAAVVKAKTNAEIAQITADKALKEQATRNAQQELKLAQSTFDYDVANRRYAADNEEKMGRFIEQQVTSEKVRQDLMKSQIKLTDKQFEAVEVGITNAIIECQQMVRESNSRISLNAANAFAAHKSGELSDKQIELVAEEKLKTAAEANGVKWDNQLKAKTLPHAVELIKNQARMSSPGWQIGMGIANGLGSALQVGAGAYLGAKGAGLARTPPLLPNPVKGFRR